MNTKLQWCAECNQWGEHGTWQHGPPVSPIEDSQERAKEFHALADKHVADLVRKHALAIENLTEQQLVTVLRQLIASGDIQRHVSSQSSITKHDQQVMYVPYAREQQLETEIARLKEALQNLSNACSQMDNMLWPDLTKVDEQILTEIDHQNILARATLKTKEAK